MEHEQDAIAFIQFSVEQINESGTLYQRIK
jgi:hypothetical protein